MHDIYGRIFVEVVCPSCLIDKIYRAVVNNIEQHFLKNTSLLVVDLTFIPFVALYFVVDTLFLIPLACPKYVRWTRSPSHSLEMEVPPATLEEQSIVRTADRTTEKSAMSEKKLDLRSMIGMSVCSVVRPLHQSSYRVRQMNYIRDLSQPPASRIRNTQGK